ncbi:ATP/GTP-binding protein [Aspergillus melleus]|uniref:ATP/GTP-binding protein n=1 Tax=Aspergillus melleus TaxID=138277 RepID=UPI001E8D4F59|nr:uncharacterized protein LDX57_002641 [Aspergillus melleus]KAH8424896.1 hypothetical protein LDX57_002641 [Aspergillus melleus]
MASNNDEPLTPKNVYIVGAHSTGKTTLFEALKQRFTSALVSEIFGPGTKGPEFIDELVRMVMYMKSYDANDIRDPVRGYQLQLHTLWTQYEMESVFHHLWIFSDRSGLDPIVYARVFLGSDESNRLLEMSEWDLLRRRMRDGLVVLCEPSNSTWLSSDPVRVALHKGEWMVLADAFRSMLQEQGIRFVAIPADMENLEHRVQFVEGLIRSGF